MRLDNGAFVGLIYSLLVFSQFHVKVVPHVTTVKVDDIIYNTWGMKEPNYVMRMMATGGRLLADDACTETVRIRNEHCRSRGEEVQVKAAI